MGIVVGEVTLGAYTDQRSLAGIARDLVGHGIARLAERVLGGERHRRHSASRGAQVSFPAENA
jgi:hypothetical protein